MKWVASKRLVLVLAVALALRMAAGLWWHSRLEGRFGFADSQSYWALGQAIARGQPYQFGSEEARIFRTPGYPLLLAPIFLPAGPQPSVMSARALSAVLGTLAVAGVWWLGREVFDARTGLLAATVAAFYPGAVALGALVLSEAPFCAMMLVQLALWVAAWKSDRLQRAVPLAACAGLVAGAACLVRPSWLLFTPFAVVLSFLGGARKRQTWIGACMLAGLILAMMPWWIRNWRLVGHFVPTTLQVGASLYDGLSPTATGESDMRFVPRFVQQERRRSVDPQADPRETLEYRLDRRLRAEAMAWAASHPVRVVQLAGIKLARMWNIWPNAPELSGWPIRMAVVFTYVPILVLGIMGAWRTFRRGWPYILCWLPAAYFTMVHLVFVSSVRYREPAMLPLMVLSAGVVLWPAGKDKPTTQSRDSPADQ